MPIFCINKKSSSVRMSTKKAKTKASSYVHRHGHRIKTSFVAHNVNLVRAIMKAAFSVDVLCFTFLTTTVLS